MAKKSKLTKVLYDALSDVEKKDYKAHEDFYVLDVEEVDGWGLDNVSGLKSSLSKEREAAQKYARDVERYKDIDPDKAREAFKKLEKLGDGTSDEKIKALVDSAVRQVEEKHAVEKKGLVDRQGVLTRAVQKSLVDAEIARVLSGKGSVDLLIEPLRKHIQVVEDKDGNFTTRVVGEDGTPLLTRKQGSNGPMSAEEFILGPFKADQRYARAFDGDGITGDGAGAAGKGGGAGPGGGGGSGGGKKFTIKESEARDPRAYQAVKAEAAKANQYVEIVPG